MGDGGRRRVASLASVLPDATAVNAVQAIGHREGGFAVTLLDVVAEPSHQLRPLAGGDQRSAFGYPHDRHILEHLVQPGPHLGKEHQRRPIRPRVDVTQHQHLRTALFVSFEAGELHAVAEHQRQVRQREDFDVVPPDVPGRQVLGQQVAHALSVMGGIGDDHVIQHPAVDDRSAGRLEKTGWPQHRQDQRGAEERLTVALLVEPAQARGEQAVQRTRLFAILLVEGVEVETQVALTDTANRQLKRLRPLFDRPPRAQRNQAFHHVVFEVVGVHCRLLAHCRCNGRLNTGLQAAVGDGNGPTANLLGRLRVWLRNDDAGTAFRRAASLHPQDYGVPHRVSRDRFARLAEQALAGIPEAFQAQMSNTLIVVDDLPTIEAVREGEDPDLLGLYEGATVLEHGLPERIVLYQRNHENVVSDDRELAEEVRETMRHEVGHHFGMAEDELPY